MLLFKRCLAGLLLLLLALVAVIYLSPRAATLAYSISQRDSQPVPPVEIAPGVYHVGTNGIASFLIETNAGLILIDSGYEHTVQPILDNIQRLGFAPADVDILLNSHAHMDHAAGLKAMKAATGAELYASPKGKTLLEKGGRQDFAFGDHLAYPPVQVDHILKDRQVFGSGHTSLTAHFTPGHTQGCTSWQISIAANNAEAGDSDPTDQNDLNALLICSLTLLPGYQLGAAESYPGITEDFNNTVGRLSNLPCDIFLTPHGRHFNLKEKMQPQQGPNATSNPFIDPEGCRAYIDNAGKKVAQRTTR